MVKSTLVTLANKNIHCQLIAPLRIRSIIESREMAREFRPNALIWIKTNCKMTGAKEREKKVKVNVFRSQPILYWQWWWCRWWCSKCWHFFVHSFIRIHSYLATLIIVFSAQCSMLGAHFTYAYRHFFSSLVYRLSFHFVSFRFTACSLFLVCKWRKCYLRLSC